MAFVRLFCIYYRVITRVMFDAEPSRDPAALCLHELTFPRSLDRLLTKLVIVHIHQMHFQYFSSKGTSPGYHSWGYVLLVPSDHLTLRVYSVERCIIVAAFCGVWAPFTGVHNPVNSSVSMCYPLLSPQGYFKNHVHKHCDGKGAVRGSMMHLKKQMKGLCLEQRRVWAELEAHALTDHCAYFVLILRTEDILSRFPFTTSPALKKKKFL